MLGRDVNMAVNEIIRAVANQLDDCEYEAFQPLLSKFATAVGRIKLMDVKDFLDNNEAEVKAIFGEFYDFLAPLLQEEIAKFQSTSPHCNI